MTGSRFSEDQFIAVLKKQEAGAKTAGVARKHRISDAMQSAARRLNGQSSV
jgi:hypothetical protein